eukprot:477669_1
MGDMTVGATNACNVAMPKTVGDGDGNVAMPKKVCDAHGPTWYYYQRCKDHVHHPKEAKAAPKDPVGCGASKEAPKDQEATPNMWISRSNIKRSAKRAGIEAQTCGYRGPMATQEVDDEVARMYSNASAHNSPKCIRKRLSCIGIKAKEWTRM